MSGSGKTSLAIGTLYAEGMQRFLDLLAGADHLIDMGPGGGRIVAAGSPGGVARAPESVTGPWLAEYLRPDLVGRAAVSS